MRLRGSTYTVSGIAPWVMEGPALSIRPGTTVLPLSGWRQSLGHHLVREASLSWWATAHFRRLRTSKGSVAP